MAEKCIVEVMPHTGPAPFKKVMKDMKPAVLNSIKPIIMPLIENAAATGDGSGDVEMAEETVKPAKKQKEAKKAAPPAEKKNLNSSMNRRQTAQVMTAKQIYEKLNKNKGGAGKKKDGDDGSLEILETGNKAKRNEADKKKRWHPEEIRDDYVAKFKNSTKAIFGDAMAIKMFTTDFKTLIKCIKLFSSTFEDEDNFLQFVEIMDVVIKWAYIKSNEVQNTSFLKDLYFFFDELIDKLIEMQYELLDAEGTII